MLYGILDTESHTFRYCNGGHEPPFLRGSSGEWTELAVGGLPLGIMASFPYEEEEVALTPGELLVMYSDRSTEAMNSASEQFGREQLLHIIQEHRQLPAGQLAERIVRAVRHHAGGAPQSDDITLVVMRRMKKE